MNEELPPIPPTWCWTDVDDLILGIKSGKSFKCEERPPRSAEVGVVKVSAVTWGTYNEEESKTCNRPEMENESLFVQPGDFLFSRANTIDLVGACVIAGVVTKQVMLSDKILRFRVRSGWDRWLLWLLRSGHGRREIQRLATGNQDSMRNIGQARIRQIRAPIPPLPEQHRIVEAIESYFTRLDDAVATLERVQANLKRYRASVLKAAVEGRLVPTEADLARDEGRDYEPASVLLERILVERRRRWEEAGKRGKYKEPVAPDTDGLPELPDGWCWATAEALTDPIRVIRYGILKPGPDLSPNGLPFVKVKHMRGNVIVPLADLPRTSPSIFDKYKAAALGKGDLLIAIRGTYDRVALVPDELDGANITQDSARVAPLPEVRREYLRHALLAPGSQSYFKRVARGVAVKGVNIRDLRPAPVPLPPLSEQGRIVEEVETQISVIDALERSTSQQLGRCKRLRQSILKWAFEGKLADQDPDDEPASVLLERIKAERPTTRKTSRRGRRKSS